MRTLPPLAAVRVFEAAARHENFTAAAGELAMTQAAVSYQVNLLEKRLGVLLFHREGKRVALSPAGRALAEKLSAAFDGMDAAFKALRSDDQALLTISTTNTFANAWFAWRLGSFQMSHPDMGVRLYATDAVVDFVREEVDVAVRLGSGGWPGVVSELLLEADLAPMCSPAFLAAHGGRIELSDLANLPRISARDTRWADWLRAAGLAPPEGFGRPGVELESQADEGHAAIAGQGVALLTPFFWRNDMADGRLVRIAEPVPNPGYGYWLVCPEHRRGVAKVRRFREWLLAEVAKDQAALSR